MGLDLRVNKLLLRVSIACLAGALIIYLFGYIFYSGLSMRDRVCDYAGNFDLVPVSSGRFPLSTRCPRGERVVEIVPVWMNPTIVTLLLVSVMTGLGGVLRAMERRPEHFD
jgi:membrane protein YqaA with SNARE-associated domain